jgi:DeoR/GlpR family transcriptional regulator of sugar metabolism
MLVPERHRHILRLLGEQGSLSVAEISSRHGVSVATARRDATELARAGLARRTRGALLPLDFSLVEPRYSRKAEKAVAAKVRMGRAAAALMPEEGTVFVDAGTTCLEVGRALLDRSALRIFTNSVPLLALAGEARAALNSVGGEVRGMSLALTGGLAQSWLENLRFDAAVVGASGLDRGTGASTTEVAEAAVKAEALRRSRRRILVAHAEKWERPSALAFAPWRAFTDFVTDRALSRDERTALSSARVEVHTLSQR